MSRKLKSIGAFLTVIVAAVLSWVGFAKLYPGEQTPAIFVERVFRVIKSLLGDPLGNATENKNLPWELVIAKILATAIVIGGVFKVVKTLFLEQYTLLSILLKRNHVVSVGIGEKGSALLHDLKKCSKQSGVAIEQNKEHKNIGKIRREGHPIIFGDAREKEILKEAGIKKARYFISFIKDEQTTLETAKTIFEIYNKEKISNPLQCFLHLENARLLEMMQESSMLRKNTGGLSFRLFNTHRMVARNFFAEFPLVYEEQIRQNKNYRVHIFGFAEQGQQLLLQALRVLHFPGNKNVEYIIADENINDKKEIFEANYPKVGKIADIKFVELNANYNAYLENFSQDKAQENVAIITFNDDKKNLAAALEILNTTPTRDFLIFAMNSSSENMNALFASDKQPRIRFFGNIHYICRMELITREKQDTLAKAIHNDYLSLQKELAESESAAYKTPWEELTEDAKNANRAQADHIAYKLVVLGKSPKDFKNLTFTDEQVEILAQTEHERWNAHRYTNGWDFGETRDNTLKLHPSLVTWDALPESEKQKDRDTILRLPKILANVNTLEI